MAYPVTRNFTAPHFLMRSLNGAQLAQFSRRGRVQFRPANGGHQGERCLLPFINAFGVDVERSRSRLGGAALAR